MKFKLLYRFLLAICTFCFANMPSIVIAQTYGQEELLEEAYETESYDLLAKFFDNWQKELKDNEAEAPDKWVAEAHKVFAALCGPEISSKINTLVNIQGPVIIAQSYLRKIGYAESFSKALKNGNWNDLTYLTIDSNIVFRPKIKIEGHSTVYLTDEYRTLLKNYLFGDKLFWDISFTIEEPENWKLTETDSLWNITNNEKDKYENSATKAQELNNEQFIAYIKSEKFKAKHSELLDRDSFLVKYAGVMTTCSYFIGINIVPFFSIDEIIFDKSFKYAVINYSRCGSGGTVILQKKGKEWKYHHLYEYWIDD